MLAINVFKFTAFVSSDWQVKNDALIHANEVMHLFWEKNCDLTLNS